MHRLIHRYNAHVVKNQTSPSSDKSNELWNQLEQFLDRLRDTNTISSQQQMQLILSSFQSIISNQEMHVNVYIHLFYQRLEQQFIQQRLKKFNDELNSFHIDDEELKLLTHFVSCLDPLHCAANAYLQIVDCINHNCKPMRDLKYDFMICVYSKLFSLYLPSQETSVFRNAISVLLLKAFHSFCIVLQIEQGVESEEEENIAEHQQVLNQFKIVCQKLNELGMSSVDPDHLNICTQECLNFIYNTIQKKIEEKYASEFDKRALEEVMPWLEEVILPFLNIFFSNKDILFKLKSKIQLFIYTCLAKLRINELFDIIKNYPDSSCALIDLKECLVQTGLHNEMIISLNRAYVIIILSNIINMFHLVVFPRD
jgi:hypothetical protein